jgi:hypothetical protein
MEQVMAETVTFDTLDEDEKAHVQNLINEVESFVQADPARAAALKANYGSAFFKGRFRNNQPEDVPLASKEDYKLLDVVLQEQEVRNRRFLEQKQKTRADSLLEHQILENQEKLRVLMESAGYKGAHDSLIALDPDELVQKLDDLLPGKNSKTMKLTPGEKEVVKSFYSCKEGLVPTLLNMMVAEEITKSQVIKELHLYDGAMTGIAKRLGVELFTAGFVEIFETVTEKVSCDVRAKNELEKFEQKKAAELAALDEQKKIAAVSAVEFEEAVEPEILDENFKPVGPGLWARMKQSKTVKGAVIAASLLAVTFGIFKLNPHSASVKSPKMAKTVPVKPDTIGKAKTVMLSQTQLAAMTPKSHHHRHHQYHVAAAAAVVDTTLTAQNKTPSTVAGDLANAVNNTVQANVAKSDSTTTANADVNAPKMAGDSTITANVTQPVDSGKVDLPVKDAIGAKEIKIVTDSVSTQSSNDSTVSADSNVVVKKTKKFKLHKEEITGSTSVQDTSVKNTAVINKSVTDSVKAETPIQRKIAGVVKDIKYLEQQNQTRSVKRDLERKQEKLTKLNEDDYKDAEHRTLGNGSYIEPMSVKYEKAQKAAQQDSTQMNGIKTNSVDINTPVAQPSVKVNDVINSNNASSTGAYKAYNYTVTPR